MAIDTGELVGVQFNDGFVRFHTDDTYSTRFAARLTPEGGHEIMQRFETAEGEEQWESFAQIPMQDVFTSGVLGLNADGTKVYLLDSRGVDIAVLKEIDLQTSKSRILAKDRNADISGGILLHPTEKTVQAASSVHERKTWHLIDKDLKRDFKYLKTLGDGEIEIISRTADDRQWIVGIELSDGPARYFRYDRDAGQAAFLFTNREVLEGETLARMHSDVIKSRDRRRMVAYYTLPVGTDTRGKGRPSEPLPTVLWVHGGPWARDSWGYNPDAPVARQPRLRSHVSVNFRGSDRLREEVPERLGQPASGAARCTTTSLDAVAWAVKKQGIADAEARCDHGWQLRRLRGPHGSEPDARDLRLRRKHRRTGQPGDVPRGDPAVLAAAGRPLGQPRG